MAINGIYRGYFQKSKCFLFPAIGMQKNPFSAAMDSFMLYPGKYTLADRRLTIYQGKNEDTEKYRAYENTFILKNKLFENFKVLPSGKMIYIFNMKPFSDDWDMVTTAKYSRLSPKLKEKIKNYFGDGSPEYDYMHSYLYPDKYFARYAKFLNGSVHALHLSVTEEMLREIGELCDPVDFKKETVDFLFKMDHLEENATA